MSLKVDCILAGFTPSLLSVFTIFLVGLFLVPVCSADISTLSRVVISYDHS